MRTHRSTASLIQFDGRVASSLGCVTVSACPRASGRVGHVSLHRLRRLHPSVGGDPSDAADALRVHDAILRGSIERHAGETLAGWQLLVVIDNCEHVLPGDASTITTILGRAGRARIVSTSRLRFGRSHRTSRDIRSCRRNARSRKPTDRPHTMSRDHAPRPSPSGVRSRRLPRRPRNRGGDRGWPGRDERQVDYAPTTMTQHPLITRWRRNAGS